MATPMLLKAATGGRWLRLLAASAALCSGHAIAAADGSWNTAANQRYTVNAQLSPTHVSADGRYAIHASVRPTPQPGTSEGRFVLNAHLLPDTKSTGALPLGTPCGPLTDPLFANGFEN